MSAHWECRQCGKRVETEDLGAHVEDVHAHPLGWNDYALVSSDGHTQRPRRTVGGGWEPEPLPFED